jgi:hypothetical protein
MAWRSTIFIVSRREEKRREQNRIEQKRKEEKRREEARRKEKRREEKRRDRTKGVFSFPEESFFCFLNVSYICV